MGLGGLAGTFPRPRRAGSLDVVTKKRPVAPLRSPSGCGNIRRAVELRVEGEAMTEADLRDLLELAEQLLAKVRKLPPGSGREEALREIASYLDRLAAISAKVKPDP
jgi:hypothetical protein